MLQTTRLSWVECQGTMAITAASCKLLLGFSHLASANVCGIAKTFEVPHVVKIHKITVKAASVCEHKLLSPTSML